MVVVDALGARHNFKISRITDDRLYGYDDNKIEISFSYAQISEIQYKKFSSGKTAGATASVVVIILVIAAAMLVAAKEMFDSNKDPDLEMPQ